MSRSFVEIFLGEGGQRLVVMRGFASGPILDLVSGFRSEGP